jgi:hypothetical protein
MKHKLTHKDEMKGGHDSHEHEHEHHHKKEHAKHAKSLPKAQVAKMARRDKEK